MGEALVERLEQQAKGRMLEGRNQYSPVQKIAQPEKEQTTEDNKTRTKLAETFNTNRQCIYIK